MIQQNIIYVYLFSPSELWGIDGYEQGLDSTAFRVLHHALRNLPVLVNVSIMKLGDCCRQAKSTALTVVEIVPGLAVRHQQVRRKSMTPELESRSADEFRRLK